MRSLNVITVAFGIILSASAANACEVAETRMDLTDLYVSMASGKSVLRPSSATSLFEGLNIQKCKGGYIQIAQGPMVPHPQFYTGMMFLSTDIARAPKCTVTKDSQKLDLGFSSVVQNKIEFARECVGIKVTAGPGESVHIVNSGQCQVVSQTTGGSEVVLKGENCLFKANQRGLQVISQVLPSCAAFLPKALTRELDLSLSIQFANDLSGKAMPDGLASKPVRLTVSSDSPHEVFAKALSHKSLTDFPVLESAEYRMMFDLTSVALTGTTETGLVAEAKYFVDRNGTDAGNQYRVPLVIKNEIYLVHMGSASVLIGSWFNSSVIPGGWAGQDGAATFNRLLDNPEPGKLNALSKQMKSGDKVVLVSRLLNPNSGTRLFGKYLAAIAARELAAKRDHKRMLISTDAGSSSIPTLPTLDGMGSLKALGELGTLNDLNNAKLRPVRELVDWPIHFNSICINGACADEASLTEGYEIQSEFNVESADFDVQLKLVKQLTSWNGKAEPARDRDLLTQVQCD